MKLTTSHIVLATLLLTSIILVRKYVIPGRHSICVRESHIMYVPKKVNHYNFQLVSSTPESQCIYEDPVTHSQILASPGEVRSLTNEPISQEPQINYIDPFDVGPGFLSAPKYASLIYSDHERLGIAINDESGHIQYLGYFDLNNKQKFAEKLSDRTYKLSFWGVLLNFMFYLIPSYICVTWFKHFVIGYHNSQTTK